MEGKGSYGIVYSNPRFPYLDKYNFNNNDIIFKAENIEDYYLKSEVSKIFFEKSEYKDEYLKYINLVNYKLPDELFNIPLNYGKICKDLVIGSQIYTYQWANDNKYDFKKIILNSPFQITFKKGVPLNQTSDISLSKIYNKIDNLFYLIKYFNDNNFLYDDLKLGNIIEIEDKYKLIDYSTLIKIEDLNKDTLSELFVNISYYYINSPVISQIIRYYVYGFKNLEKIIDGECKTNKIYINDLINQFESILKDYSLEIDFFDLITKDNIKINILDILIEIVNYTEENNNNEIYFTELIKYLDIKYDNDIFKKLQDLSKRMNCYQLGILLLNLLVQKKKIINDYDYLIFLKIVELLSSMILNFIVINEKVYIFEPNIDNNIEKYKFFINSYKK